MSKADATLSEDLVEHVASEVRGLIAKFSMTQADLAALLQLSQGAVSNRMRGAQAFQLREIETIALYFVGGHEKLPSDGHGVARWWS